MPAAPSDVPGAVAAGPWCCWRLALASVALVGATWGVAAGRAQTAPMPARAVCAASLIDGRSDQPLIDACVLIQGEVITTVGSRQTVPAGIDLVDLGDATLMPGLIDGHSHPLIHGDDYQVDHLRDSSAYKALRGLRAVQDNLRAGWTTLRIAGDADVFYAHLEVRRAIQEGLFVGPRITGAGHYMSVTGGGGDINHFSPEQAIVADGLVVDGVDEVRKAVREEIKNGSDWIKLLVTGAFMSQGDNPANIHFSPEELDAAVQEASRRGVPVMAHAHATEGIEMAIRAGVRSIEHGTFLNDEVINLMVERDIYLVPTVYIGQYYIDEGDPEGPQAKMIELSKTSQAEFVGRLGDAIAAGVKIVAGSDFGGYDAALNVREIESLAEAGMGSMRAIQAATSVAAEMLGWDDRIGTLESGKLADVIAVRGDPLADITRLREPIFVMVGGKIVPLSPD